MLAGPVGVRVTSSGGELKPTPLPEWCKALELDNKTVIKGKEPSKQQPKTEPDSIQPGSGCWISKEKKDTSASSCKSIAPASGGSSETSPLTTVLPDKSKFFIADDLVVKKNNSTQEQPQMCCATKSLV